MGQRCKGTFAAIDLGQYLGEIATQTLRVLETRPGQVQLRLTVASLQVGLEQATPCGLLISELMSNCLKHAFPEDRAGEICIELSPLPKPGEPGEPDQPGVWRLRVSDNGVGLAADFSTKRQDTLGLQLADDMARQMGGSLHTQAGPQAVFTVDFKAAPPKSLVFQL